jgi:PAS domain S-box-containing protein
MAEPAQPRAVTGGPHSDTLYRRLVETVSDYAILVLDPEGHVTSWNAGAERIKGYTADEIIGRHFSHFYPQEAVDRGWPEEELRRATEEGRFEDEGWRVRKDGSRFWANVVITTLRDDAGRLVGFTKVTRDLTARRETEEQARRLAAEKAAHAEAVRRSEELQEALTAAQEARAAAECATAAVTEAYRELDQFAYVASHDLKAPLRGIANLAQWIQDDLGDALNGESAEHLRLLQGRVHRMESLIDGILAYSRAGRVRNAPEPVDTGVLVREVIELLAPPAGVTIEVPEQLPTLWAERVPLQQVFLNLLGNALKFGSAECPDVTIHLECRDLGDDVEFAVRDNGPGIAPEYHDRIWGIFQTLAARDKVEGTGIGLSVVKKVVESRGGRVALESAPGRGATFRFTWPRTPR